MIRMTHRADVAGSNDDRVVTVTCSTETLGRDDIVLVSAGIQLDRYRQNPVWLWQHNPDWPIARAEDISVVENKLVARVRFPPQGVSARADEILGLIRAGVVNAASTGFETLEAEPIDRAKPNGGMKITRCELQEVSFVSIPAVPDALVTERALEEVRRMAKTRAEADWTVGAARDLPIDDSEAWDGQAAEDSIFAYAGGDEFDPEKAKRGFLIYNAAEPKLRGSYKLPFARAVNGELKAVTEGLRAAASRLPQTNAPQDVLDEARQVVDQYEEKAGVGEEERRRIAAVKRAFVRRSLYDVGSLAYLLEQLGWIKDCAAFEKSIEEDESQVPAMLGQALQQLGAALVAMTQEEVAELLANNNSEIEPESATEEVIIEQSASPAVARFRIGVQRARRALRRRQAARPAVKRSITFHRRMAALYQREALDPA